MWFWLSKQWGTTERERVFVCARKALTSDSKSRVRQDREPAMGRTARPCVWWSKFSISVISELTRRATFVTEKLVKSWPSWRWEVWKWISEIIQFVLIPSSAGTLTSLKTSCSLWRPRLPTDLPSGPQPEPRSCSSPSAPSRMNPLGVKKPAFQRCCCSQPSVQPRSLTCKSVVLAPVILHGSFQFQNLSTVIIFFFLTDCGLENLRSPVRDWTHAPCSGSVES